MSADPTDLLAPHGADPAGTPEAGDVWLNRDWPTNLQPAGSYGDTVVATVNF